MMAKALTLVVVTAAGAHPMLFIKNSINEARPTQPPLTQAPVKSAETVLSCGGGVLEPLTPDISRRIAEIKEEQRPVADITRASEKRTIEQANNLVRTVMKVGGFKQFAERTRYWINHSPANSPECNALLGIQRFWDDLAAKSSP